MKTEADKKLLASFRATWKLKITSVGTFERYKKCRKFVADKYDLSKNKDIRRKIKDNPKEILESLKEKYTNLNTLQTYLSGFNMMLKRMTFLTTKDTPFAVELRRVRKELDVLVPERSEERQLLGLIKAEYYAKTLDEAIEKFVERTVDEINVWIRERVDDSVDLDDFNTKHSRTFHYSETVKGEIDGKMAGQSVIVNKARAVLAINLQIAESSIGRGTETRTLEFYKRDLKNQNYISIQKKIARCGDYKTVNRYGAYDIRLSDELIQLVRFVRFFTPGKNMFVNGKGNVMRRIEYNRLFGHFFPSVSPMKLRKMAITEREIFTQQEDEPIFTGNTLETRLKYYDIREKEGERSASASSEEPEDIED